MEDRKAKLETRDLNLWPIGRTDTSQESAHQELSIFVSPLSSLCAQICHVDVIAGVGHKESGYRLIVAETIALSIERRGVCSSCFSGPGQKYPFFKT